jgi:hypothetical protein
LGGTQFQVASGKKHCKATLEIKNADAFTKEPAGRGTGGLGTSANWQFRSFGNGDRLVGIALWALADHTVAGAHRRRRQAPERGGMEERNQHAHLDIVAPIGGEVEIRELLR